MTHLEWLNTRLLLWAGQGGKGESTYAHTDRGLGIHKHYDTVSYC